MIEPRHHTFSDVFDEDKEALAAKLKGSLFDFVCTFFPIVTGKDFIVSRPLGREPHAITMCRALTAAIRLKLPTHRLLLNIAPGTGKSTLCCMAIAWSMARYPDSNWLYISYSKTLATKQTAFIKAIMSCKEYGYLFDVHLRKDSTAKDLFATTAGGTVGAYGSGGSITGQDAGLPGLERFTGGIMIDDPIKPDEAHSDTIRENVIRNYQETISMRPRDFKVPLIFIGQRLHEADLAQWLIDGNDIYDWEKVIIKSLDEAGNALYPEAFPLDMLLRLQESSPYAFAAQHQQNPMPAGGALFKRAGFTLLREEPEEYLYTFITADTAETDKTYNDATAFSFFGLYAVTVNGIKTGQYALHWIDCVELHIEPKDLEAAFFDFYSDCVRHKCPPMLAAIENKSTGVTLSSVLQKTQGLTVRRIKVTAADGSKANRFLSMQAYINSGLLSLTASSEEEDRPVSRMKHVLDHMEKITANDTHRRDDICDTAYWAVKLALIDKHGIPTNIGRHRSQDILNDLANNFNQRVNAGAIIHGRTR